MKAKYLFLPLSSMMWATALVPLVGTGNNTWIEIKTNPKTCKSEDFSQCIELDARGKTFQFSPAIFLNTYRFWGFYLFLQ